MHGMHRVDRDMRAGDAVLWTPINEIGGTPVRDAMVHCVNRVYSYKYDPFHAWIACRPLYAACVDSGCTQLAVTDRPVDCMACIAASCEPS